MLLIMGAAWVGVVVEVVVVKGSGDADSSRHRARDPIRVCDGGGGRATREQRWRGGGGLQSGRSSSLS